MSNFDQFLLRAKWNWAKTYEKKAPHWYVVRSEFADDELFNRVVEEMRQKAVPEKFFSKTFFYFYHGGYKYWTMGNPIEQTTIINRAKVEWNISTMRTY